MKKIIFVFLVTFLLSACAPAATAISTSTPLPAATQTPNPTPTIVPTPTQVGGGSGKLIFEYYKIGFQGQFPDLKGEVHVFTSNLDSDNLMPVTKGLNSSNHIENISADGQMVLISSHSNYPAKGDLYLIRLKPQDSTPIKLASGLAWSRWPQAIFLDNTRIVYISQGQEGYGFYSANIDGTNPTKLGAPDANYAGMISKDKTRIYYEGFTKENLKDSSGFLYAHGDFETIWWINVDGSGQGKLESNGQPILPAGFGEETAFSPNGLNIAWIPTQLEPNCSWNDGDSLWAPWVKDSVYTQHATNKNSAMFGKVVDTAYVEDLVRRCFILHVASLSDMDNPTKIPLMPPFDPNKDGFTYHHHYELVWSSDSSKILAFDDGSSSKYTDGYADFANFYPIAIYALSPKDINPDLVLLKILSMGVSDENKFDLLSPSPDGKQLLFTKHGEGPYIKIFNLETMNFVDEFGSVITPDSQTQRIGDIYWLP